MNSAMTLNKNGFFKSLLWNADALEEVCLDYLATANIPNVSGLCAVLGATPAQIRAVFSTWDAAPGSSSDPLAPTESAMHVLANTLMHIEDGLIVGGLREVYNAHMTKFVLSSLHDRHEKHLQETISDKTVRIRLESHSPVTLEELREYDRLERAIADQERTELVALGKIEEIETNRANPALCNEYVI